MRRRDPVGVDDSGVPLPTDPKQPWPPKWWEPVARDITEAAAWFSGDPGQLANYYSTTPVPQQMSQTRFWRRPQTTTEARRLHLPASSDIASASADLLFGEAPMFIIPEAHATDDHAADATARKAEQRLHEIMAEDGTVSTLLSAAEVCSGMGDVYLRPVWDTSLFDCPVLSVVHADAAVPEFVYGKMVAVTFWRELERDKGGKVFRHLERHAKGSIEHALYAGSADTIGRRVPLEMNSALASLDVDESGMVRLPAGLQDRMIARHVPNVQPNRKHRSMGVGRADTAGAEGFMDALDEVWSAWVREIRLGKLRIIVAKDFLQAGGRGTGQWFDGDQEVFSPLDLDPSAEGTEGITPISFPLRVAEYESTAQALFEQVVMAASYGPQTFGEHGDGGMSTATEVQAKDTRSLRTTGRKQGYWQQPLEDVAEMLLIIDREVYQNADAGEFRPTVQFGDPAGSNLQAMATTVQQLEAAQAVSAQIKVQLIHPEWDADQVAAEVGRIRDEHGMSVMSPVGDIPPNGEPNFGA